jgi:hypothetical protein
MRPGFPGPQRCCSRRSGIRRATCGSPIVSRQARNRPQKGRQAAAAGPCRGGQRFVREGQTTAWLISPVVGGQHQAAPEVTKITRRSRVHSAQQLMHLVRLAEDRRTSSSQPSPHASLHHTTRVLAFLSDVTGSPASNKPVLRLRLRPGAANRSTTDTFLLINPHRTMHSDGSMMQPDRPRNAGNTREPVG